LSNQYCNFPSDDRVPPHAFSSYNNLLTDSGWLTDVVRASSQQPRLYVGMVLILIFAEVLGLYGVIVSILMITKSNEDVTVCIY
jgi:hypothetical protein